MKYPIAIIITVCLILSLMVSFCPAETEEDFKISEIDEATFARMKGKSYKDDCPIPLGDLRLLHVLHKDLEGNTHKGELVCNVYIASDVLEIFKALYEVGYPIERVRLVDEYNADDETSMRDNNSSCFNFRFISHTTRISKHGLGLAVDINTLYNPFVKEVNGKRNVEPATAEEYTDRTKSFPYKIESGDLCYRLFTERGFEWGGEWKTVKDYQHFEVSDKVAEELYPNYR
ncbi:MAG: M15 family metallopeptidase [Synergistaceae bacterium]|nr:M15 family metallopeptidase [Synergistaceae bacterium]